MGHASIITEKLLKKMENNSGVQEQEQGVIIVEESIMSEVEVMEIKKVDKSRSGCDETESSLCKVSSCEVNILNRKVFKTDHCIVST